MAAPAPTYGSLVEYGKRFLIGAGSPEDAGDAAELLCAAAACGMAKLRAELGAPVAPGVVERFCGYLARRARHEPIQYIAGSWEFMGLEFRISRHTLIPRPDTECLAEHAMRVAQEHFPRKLARGALRILDLCTGSGCVGISLAHYLKGAAVVASDISPAALAVARENAAIHGLSGRVSFLQGDMFGALKDGGAGQFDIICANPPYIPSGELASLPPDVALYEPREALDGGALGTDFHRRIAAGAPRFIGRGGFVAVEVGAGQAREVSRIFSESGWSGVRAIKDIPGVERVVSARRSQA
jgi:release factor glutamine methyltransferase